MKPLEIFCRNRLLYVRMSVEYKGTGMKDYCVWHIYLNNGYVSSIQYDPFTKKIHYCLDEKTLLTEEHIQKYITMIQHGEISWRKGEGR